MLWSERFVGIFEKKRSGLLASLQFSQATRAEAAATVAQEDEAIAYLESFIAELDAAISIMKQEA